MGNDVKKAAAAMKARSGEAMSTVMSTVSSRGPKHSKIFSEWLENKAAWEREPHRITPAPEFSGPNYFDLNYDATLVLFSFFHPQTLCRMAAVSKSSRTLAESNDYWLPWFRAHKGITIVPRALVSSPDIYWKAVYEKATTKYENIKEGMTACVDGDALLLPAQTFYEHLDMNKPNITLMGVPDADGSRPVIELTTDHVAIVSATGCCFQNLEFRQPVGENITCIHVHSSLAFALDSCVLTSQAHSCMCIGSTSSVTGVVTLNNCELRNFKNRGVLVMQGSIQVHNCRFHDGPNALLFNTNASAIVRDSEFSRIESASVFAMFANGSLELSGCRFRDVGGGVWVSNGARGMCSRCGALDFQGFKWGALEVHDGSELTVSDSVVHDSEHESSNGIYSIDSTIKITNCDFRELQRAGVQTIRSKVEIRKSRFQHLDVGVSVYNKSKLTAFESEFDRNKSAIRVGADTQFALSDCLLQRSTECAAHITRLATDESNTSDEGLATELEKTNRFERNANNVIVQRLVLTASDLGGVSPEAYLAAQQRICTFKFTGSNYHPQRVFRCITCKLTEARGMCIVCKEICHEGHEIEIDPEIKPFFCDCGAEKFCDVLLKSSRGGDAVISATL